MIKGLIERVVADPELRDMVHKPRRRRPRPPDGKMIWVSPEGTQARQPVLHAAALQQLMDNAAVKPE